MELHEFFKIDSIVSNDMIKATSFDIIAYEKNKLAERLLKKVDFSKCKAFGLYYEEEKITKQHHNNLSIVENANVNNMPNGYVKLTANLEVIKNA